MLASKGNGNIITPAMPLPKLYGGQPVLHQDFVMGSLIENGTTCSSRQIVCLATSEPTFGAVMTESAHSSQYILHPLNNNPATVAGGTRQTFSTYSINLQGAQAHSNDLHHKYIKECLQDTGTPLFLTEPGRVQPS